MMSFNYCAISLVTGSTFSAFDSIGIDCTLGKEGISICQFLDLIPKDFEKLLADNCSFFFGIYNALQLIIKLFRAIHPDKVHIEKIGKCLFNKIAFVLSHQPLINKYTG